jgi:hypothetical protein
MMNDVPLEYVVMRRRLSNWEAFTSILGPVVRAGISVKHVVVQGIQNMVAPDPVSFSYTHKFAGSAVAVDLIARDFISTHVYGDMAGFRSGLEPVIEQIHTVSRVPSELLSKFPNSIDTYDNCSDAILARRFKEVQRVIPESEITTIKDFQSLVVSVYNIMTMTR